MDQHPPAWQAAPEPAPATLRIEVLGTFRVTLAEREVPDGSWRLSKARSLIKLLALSPGRRLHRDQVIDLLWPDLEPAAATNNLHQALHAARRALASIAPPDQEFSALPLQRQVLVLDPPVPIWIDAEAFESAARSALADDDPATGYAAIDLYTGDLLPEDRYEEWTIEQRDSLREQYLQVLARLAALHAGRHEYPPAIEALRRLIAQDPAREEAYADLMRLYALTGRQQQALRLYQRLSDALAEEFDAEPAPETQRLYSAILDRRFPPPSPPSERQVVSAPSRVEPPPPEEPRLGPFVDRERELALLLGGLDEAMAGRGQAVLLVGDPGIGKTRLIEQAARIARERGVRVYWGRCYAGDGAPAYWPWAQIIRAHAATTPVERLGAQLGGSAADIALVVPQLRERLPDLPALPTLDPEQARFRLFDGVAGFLSRAAMEQPLVLVLDDLHWADRSSLALLEFLADSLRTLPLLIVGAYRGGDIDRRHPLTHTLARLSREEAGQRIHLSGFGPQDIARYNEITTGQASPTGLAEAIHAQTEGNPFFVREVVRLLVEEGRYVGTDDVRSWRISIPQGVREAVLLRLDLLSDRASHVLMIASVIGRDFTLPVLEAVCDLPAEDVLAAVEEGLAAGTVDERTVRSSGFRFGHALIQQTLYEELSRARRIGLHRRTAEVIERLYAANLTPWLDVLAWHYYQSAADGEAGPAVDYLTLAGRHSMDQVAWAEAARHYTRALELLDAAAGPDDPQRCDLLLALGNAQQHAGNTTQARATYQRAAAVARGGGAPQQLAQAALGISATEEEVDAADTSSVALLEEALTVLGGAPSAPRAMTLARLSQVLLYHEHAATERRRTLSDEAVAIARGLGDDSTLATALIARLDAHWDPANLAERLADSTEIVALATRAGDARLALTGHAMHLIDQMESGDMLAADAQIDAYGRIAEELHYTYGRWSHAIKRTMRALMRGAFAEAEHLAQEAHVLGQRPAPRTADDVYLVHRFALAREIGGLDDVGARIRQIDRTTPIHSRIFPYLLAQLYADEARTAEAAAEYQEVLRGGLERIPLDPHWLFSLALLSDVCVFLEDRQTAAQLYRMLEPYAGRNVSIGSNVLCVGPAAYYLALLARALEQEERALEHCAAALALSRQMDAPPFIARAQLLHAELLLQRGEQPAARAVLAEAQAMCRRLAMTQMDRRIAVLLSLR